MKESEIRDREAHARYLNLVAEDVRTMFGDRSSLRAVPCPACRVDDVRPAFEKSGFRYVTCAGCRTLYVNPRPSPDALAAFYTDSPSSRFWVDGFFRPVMEARRQKVFAPRAELVASAFPEGGRVGDIGAGFGLFLEELGKLRPSAELVAIEPSPEMAAICSDKGLCVICSTVEQLRGHDASFDVLTSFELLEHLHEPRAMVVRAFELLRPGGRLFLTTLNGEGFDIQVLWDHADAASPPHHLNLLNPDSLDSLLRDAGFEDVTVSTPGRLDWDIVEGAVVRDRVDAGRFWALVARSDERCRAEFQEWISRNGLSSHMRAVARRPR